MTKKKDELTAEDLAAFREAMRGVKKLTHTINISLKRTAPPPRRRPRPAPEETMLCPFSDYEKLAPVGVNEIIHYAVSGVNSKDLRKLRQGLWPIDAKLDLHGNTVEQARDALARFLLQCKAHQYRHVLIIHGKGRHFDRPVLKNKLNLWLRQTAQVIAFYSAVAKDGSTGALYVLLKK